MASCELSSPIKLDNACTLPATRPMSKGSLSPSLLEEKDKNATNTDVMASSPSIERAKRLPPTPPLHKRQRRPRSVLATAKSALRTLFQQSPLVLNEDPESDGEHDFIEISRSGMLRIAQEVRSKIQELYGTALNVDEETGKVTVDYVRVVHSDDFARYLQAVKKLRYVDPTRLDHTERTAFFLNLYNALMIHGVVRLPRPQNAFQRLSIFDTAAYNIGGRIYTLNDIEHGVLRANKGNGRVFAMPQFDEGDARAQCALPKVDPRIHFSLNCACRSCPSIRFYSPENLNEAMDAATRAFLLDVEIDMERREVKISQILKWYQDDFADGGMYEVLKWTLPYLEEEKKTQLQQLLADHEAGKAWLRVTYANYDWSLNDSFFWWQ